MSQPSNLYAEKVYSEHPTILWALDDQADYISLITENQRDIRNDRTYFHYYYSKPFSLEGFILDDEEEAALHMSLSVLDVLKDTKYAASYKTLIQRLVVQANGYQKPDIIEFEKPVKQAESYLFDQLYESIIDEQTSLTTGSPFLLTHHQ